MGRKEQRRVIRVDLDTPLPVTISSIGSTVRYELQTKDISSSGFFLDFDKPSRFPFTEASILEVWLKIDGGEPIFFNGKLARIVRPTAEDPTPAHTGIAIRIIQIESESEKRLAAFLQSKMDAAPQALPKSA